MVIGRAIERKKEVRRVGRRIRTVAPRVATSSGQIRLADLRAELREVPSATLDDVLYALEQERSVLLYPLNNPQEIRPEDRKAALPNTLGGPPRHIIYVLEGTMVIKGKKKDKAGRGGPLARLRRALLKGRGG